MSMHIDFTQFSRFWKNPEEYRLAHLKNITPVKTEPYFGLGENVHLRLEAQSQGWDFNKLENELLERNIQMYDDEALVLLDALNVYRATHKMTVLESEQRWELELPDGNYMGGKIDEILQIFHKKFASDVKTMSERQTIKTAVEEVRNEWEGTITGAQANFGLIGAGVLGHKCNDFRVQVICKIKTRVPCLCGGKRCKHPKEYITEPQVFPVDVYRSDLELEDFKRDVMMTCFIIESLIDKYGIDQPWPHIVQGRWSGYTCSGRAKQHECTYKNVCGADLTGACFGEGVLKGFQPRKRDYRL